jgi:regulator of sigma E protease
MLASLLQNAMAVPLLILFFSVSIFVHEFGHFLAARLLGMVVDAFSIGFGPAIWKKKHNGVVYKIGCIPLGGYVALPQLDPAGMQTIQGADGTTTERKLPRIAPWRKILVSLAGAAGNVLLALGLAWLVYWIGMPAGPAERSAAVGYVDPECKAFAAGLRIGDEIQSVNGTAVRNWPEFLQVSTLHADVTLQVKTLSGEARTISVPTQKTILGQMVGGLDGRNLCSVLSVDAEMSAAKAGIRSGDRIVEFNGREVFSRSHLIEMVNERKDHPARVAVLRDVDGQMTRVEMDVTPSYDKTHKQVRIGIQFNLAAVEMDTLVRPLPSEQLRQHSMAIFRFLRALVTPQQAKAAAQGVGGPVAIVASYWIIVRTSIMLAVWFTGFLNVNLAIINLLPMPVLDGGHVLFSLWEMIARKPMSARVVNVLVNTFAVFIIGVFLLLSVRDVDRFTSLGRLLRGAFHGNRGDTATNAVPESAAGPGVTNAPAPAGKP